MNIYKQKLWLGRVVALLIIGVLVLTACSSSAEKTAPVDTTHYVIELSESGMVVPEQLPAGLVSIAFKNNGQAPHLPEIARLNEGVSLEEVGAAAAGEDPFAALATGSTVGWNSTNAWRESGHCV